MKTSNRGHILEASMYIMEIKDLAENLLKDSQNLTPMQINHLKYVAGNMFFAGRHLDKVLATYKR